ncbi:putative E3 ubiquitin-protein ligase SINA-like 6 [Panicum virgatum]|uniref:putative E3 ubiquitin-protein ligase SINA-like 6 n=1 Tax=Panicum virgatum TaxID=38727 RepID=UPI0019D52BAC|nr:putative E3 ubiquitin-protein ligase SINA-like 6 [Panicum virgatum]
MGGSETPSPMEDGERSSAKRARVRSPPGARVKQEVPAGDEEASQGSALAAVDGAAARAEVVVRIDKEMLHCPICTFPLKPPIFQLPRPAPHQPVPLLRRRRPLRSLPGHGLMDVFVAKAVVPCPHQAHGCEASVAYYQAADHGTACPHAPCGCGEPGCAFAGSPAALVAHLAAAPHSWPVDHVRYGETVRLRVAEPEARRLLVAEEEEDGGGGGGRRVFVLAVGDRAARAVPVTVSCVRAPGAAVAGPQYTCKLWATGGKAPATGKVESVLVDMEVPSAAAAGAVAADDEEATFLGVPRKMLRGAARQMLLSVRIDRASG